MSKSKKSFVGKTISKKVISWILVLAMILGLAPANLTLVAQAAAPTVTVYFEKPDTWTTPVINVWDTSATVVAGEDVEVVDPWNKSVPSLKEDTESGLYYAEVVSSNWSGFQFVNAETATEFEISDAGVMKAFNEFTKETSVYYLADEEGTYAWYTDAAGNTKLEIPEVELKEEYYVVGSIVSTKWDEKATTTQLSKNDDGTYSVELKAVAAGEYEFKVLQDPVNFAWNYAWGGADGGNYKLTLDKMSDVTITINPTDETKQITVEAAEVDEAIATLQSPVYEEDGSITFNYVGEAGKSISVKGDFNNWSFVSMTETETSTEGTSIYTANVTGIEAAGIYTYGIAEVDEAGEQKEWLGDPLNKCKYGTNVAFIRNAVVNDIGVTTIYVPNGKDYTVYYCEKQETSPATPAYEVTLGATVDAEAVEEAGYKSVSLALDGSFTEGMYSAKIADGLGTYQYFIADASGKVIGDPYNLTSDAAVKTFTVSKFDEELVNLKSPVVNKDRSVTFNYVDSTLTEGTNISVVGSFNGWGDSIGKVVMENANKEKGIWSKTIEGFTPGVYEYKFVKGAAGWMSDPLATVVNSEENGIFVVTGLALKQSLQVEKNNTLTLPEKANLFTEGNVTATEDTVTFALEDTTAQGVVLENGVLSVTDEYTEKTVALTMTNGTETETVTVDVVDKMYQYTIHYYATDVAYDATDLWIWEADGTPYDTGYVFNKETEADKLGRKWATAEYKFPTDGINFIARSKDAWTWQDVTRTIYIPEGQDSIEIWVIKDNLLVFTEWAEEFEEPEKRYILIEYNRPAGDYDDWNVYTWNSGANSSLNKLNYFKEIEGKMTAEIEIGTMTSSIGFLIRKGETWDKDVEGDRSIAAPLDQKVVKVKATQGCLELETVPYNKGCELQVNDHKMTYYYRDDELFMAGTLDKLSKVEVEIDGTKHEMTYDAEEERYEYVVENPEEKTYEYRFFATDAEGNVKETRDLFNDKTTVDGTKSVIEYKDIEVKVTGTVNAAIDYNENAVLSVKAETVGQEAAQVSPDVPTNGLEITECYADLTALGGKAKTPIETQLMELSIAVSDKVTAGEKNIPITVVDQYGKRHTGNATVTVKTRTTIDGDFDWDEAVIYFMVTDRFNDGNESNNDAYGVGDYNVGENGNSSYHGGDFAGVTEKLDYLKELGINTIWITPVVENILADQHDDGTDMATYGYHGYWASSFEKLNKHLGTIEEFHTLIDEAHERNIRIMVDIVANHAGYGTTESEEFSGMFRDENVDGHDILGALSNLPDFATERAEVREKLVEWQTAWVEEIAKTEKGNTIDYFRVDTVKHVDSTTWAAIKNSLTKVAPTFKMIGEYAGAGYVDDFGYLNSGKMDSLLDFGFNDTARKFVTGELDSMEQELEARNATINNTGTLGSFLGSHDEDGFKYTLIQLGYSEEEAQALTNVAASLQITAKGQPVIYYGEEVGLSGANNWPYQENRYDMQFENLTEEQEETLTHYKKLLKARADYSETFAKGTRTKVAGSDDDGYVVFKRSNNNGQEKEDIYVALNTTAVEKKVSINLGTGKVVTPDTPSADAATEELVDVYSGNKVSVVNGVMTIVIPPTSEGGTVIIPSTKKLTGIEVTAPTKTTYEVGETLDLTGLVVTGVYGTDKVEIPAVDYTVDTSKVNMAKAGTYTVTVTVGEFTGTFTITVKAKSGAGTEAGSGGEAGTVQPKPTSEPTDTSYVKVTSIKLNTSKVKLGNKASVTLKATVNPTNATYKKVEWSSNNKKAATVSKKGVVTAKKVKKKTTVIITAAVKDGKNTVTKKCTVTVLPGTSYKIKYVVGKGKNNELNPSYIAKKQTITLKNPTRKGYEFLGWYVNGKKVKKLTGSKNVTVTAKWKKINISKVTLNSAKNSSSKKIVVKYTKVKNVDGYEVVYATNSKFKNAKTTTEKAKKSSVTIKGLTKGKTYYVKVRGYKKDSTGNKKYGKYSKVKTVKVTK